MCASIPLHKATCCWERYRDREQQHISLFIHSDLCPTGAISRVANRPASHESIKKSYNEASVNIQELVSSWGLFSFGIVDVNSEVVDQLGAAVRVSLRLSSIQRSPLEPLSSVDAALISEHSPGGEKNFTTTKLHFYFSPPSRGAERLAENVVTLSNCVFHFALTNDDIHLRHHQ